MRTTDLYKQESENTDEILDGLFKLWLSDKPKMKVLVPDNAKSMISAMARSTLSDLNIQIETPPVKESWSHGLMERCVQEVENVASKVSLSFPSCSPPSIVAISVNALNSTEVNQGYAPHQWVYGKQFTFTEEDERSMQLAMPEVEGPDFVTLLSNRHVAEELARKARAQVVLNKLHNSKARQPLQVFEPMDLVKIWRKYSTDGGGRGGLRKLGHAQWLGPGRVVFHEVIHGQRPGDERRHIVWVIVAGTMHRCSVHSVRKVTERERLDYELHHPEDPSQWKSLSDMVPKRSFIDLLPEEPDENEEEFPRLPAAPDKSTVFKDLRPPEPFSPLRGLEEYTPSEPPAEALPPAEAPLPLNDYGDEPTFQTGGDEDEITGTALGSGIPTLTERTAPLSGQQPLLSISSDSGGKSDAPPREPDSKKARIDDADEQFFNTLELIDEGILMTIEWEFHSNREKERFVRRPSLFLAQKMRDCEVRLVSLKPAHRELFRRAKTKEVNSFLTNTAVRRCLDKQEEMLAWNSGRIMRCRWVLTWKPTPEEGLAEALEEVRTKPDTTTLTEDGLKKAKARIVLLGFEHPDLLSDGHKTSSPVQALLSRNISYQLVMEEGWDIEGIDMSTAFLQTLPTEEEKQLWTTGVSELREALGIPENGVMRILKNFYGSTTAPRNLWQNVDQSMKKLGAITLRGDSCFWLWLVDNERFDPQKDPPHFRFRPLGFVAGHVDDFHRAGDVTDERWLRIKKEVDQIYRWGTAKQSSYRHAGTDLEMVQDAKHGRCLVVSQQYYVETLQDVSIDPKRFSMSDELMTAKEITACRGALGALQWLAVQSQPLICARVNLLLTELSTSPRMSIAQELQEMVRELRKSNSTLKFFKLPGVNHWTQLCVVGLGDQAHNNRPKGGSTGGMLVFLSNQDALKGVPCPLVLVAWRSWKLKRVAIGTNDAEMQALVETEDVVYRTRLLWAGMHGTSLLYGGRNLLEATDQEVQHVVGVLGTDSKGGWDSVMVNESPLLGLSNTRAAIQAHQLKQALRLCGTHLLWLAGDWNLSDSLTKKKPESRDSMLFYLKHRLWQLRFEPQFIESARKIKKSKGTPVQQMSQVKNSESFGVDAIHLMSHYLSM